MTNENTQANPEREQTDESLRLEREKADDALGEKLAALEETADAVIIRARERADKLLADARARTDRQIHSVDQHRTERVERARARADEVVRGERADADAIVRRERAAHVALLTSERDETDRDLSSERERADDALATRDEFLGIVSHDLRTLLNTMVGYAGLIAGASMETHREQVRVHAQRIERAGARMTRLIGDLVDVASIEAGALTVTREVGDPAQVVTEAVETFHAQATACGVALAAEIASPVAEAAFDPARILQVLTNLISNAIKFTPAGGHVVVRVERDSGELRYSVSDTGVGIAPDKLEVIFERFHQIARNDRRGLGLGLYISKCIVQGHGGRIWAESSDGDGSRFSFTLPDAPA